MKGVLGALAVASAKNLAVRHEPFTALEHINLNMGREWSQKTDDFFFQVLRCTLDPRSEKILNRTNDARRREGQPDMGELRWVNLGLQQFHLPVNDQVGGVPLTQRLRGEIVVVWPASKIAGLRHRLEQWGANVTGEDVLKFVGPFGNRFIVEPSEDEEWFGPASTLNDTRDAPPGGPSEGLGIKAVRFDVPNNGTARKICAFYDSVFSADVQFSDDVCTLLIGFHQSLVFVESPDPLPPDDGLHVALYVNFDPFVAAYFKAKDLVFHNPRSPQFNFDTIDNVLHHDEFQFKDITDLETGDLLYQLEHEIRALSHDGFTLKHRLPGYDDNETTQGCTDVPAAPHETALLFDHPHVSSTPL